DDSSFVSHPGRGGHKLSRLPSRPLPLPFTGQLPPVEGEKQLKVSPGQSRLLQILETFSQGRGAE
ncbi:serine/threonine-protein kinase SBK1 X2, partial [Biomphalaria glabrata]